MDGVKSSNTFIGTIDHLSFNDLNYFTIYFCRFYTYTRPIRIKYNSIYKIVLSILNYFKPQS